MEEGPDEERNVEIVAMRDGGASWKDIAERYGLTRQQARYAYQLGKRKERRGSSKQSREGV